MHVRDVGTVDSGGRNLLEGQGQCQGQHQGQHQGLMREAQEGALLEEEYVALREAIVP